MDISRESFIARTAALRCRYSNIAFLAFIEGAKFADENPDWNNPKKRLPEDGQLVLALDKFNYIHVVRFIADSSAWVDQIDSNHEYSGIVLWMPKPKTPVLAIQDNKKEDNGTDKQYSFQELEELAISNFKRIKNLISEEHAEFMTQYGDYLKNRRKTNETNNKNNI